MSKHCHCIIIFPFPGLREGSPGHELFLRIVEESIGDANPIVVYDKRSRGPKDTMKILSRLKTKGVEIVSVWGVDTCQDWLSGWGYVLDNYVQPPEEDHRIVILPGDLEHVEPAVKFFAQLGTFISSDEKPFLIGDFDSRNPRSAKELIDTYGVYPLIANWFPQAWQAIGSFGLKKLRSEFINISAQELRRLLKSRVYAYEQTLNMLIVNWNWCWIESGENFFRAESLWREHVGKMDLGTLTDDPSTRHYRGAIDQIERTERMLRMLWRELNEWNPSQNVDTFKKLAEAYARLDERSTRIRDAARIAIWAQLQVQDSTDRQLS